MTVTRYFYDCEFVEDGKTIDLVSIGIVASDGREYYAVSADFNQAAFLGNPWLVANVLPSLPLIRSAPFADHLQLDWDHPDRDAVKHRSIIASEVKQFLTYNSQAWRDNELWGWYSAYDHVALCQLFGRMIDLPPGVPMWTNDLQQVAWHMDVPDLKKLCPQPAGAHNALEDARWNERAWQALGQHAIDHPGKL